MLIAIVLLILYQVLKGGHKRLSDIGAMSIIIWNIYSLAVVEVLSCGNLLTGQMFLLCWGAFDLVLFYLIIRIMQFDLVHFCQTIKSLTYENILKLKRMKWNHVILIITGTTVLILALFTVPYNWDSMTYHLPRIAHWAQNKSAAHYASNSVRQLASPVLAEFINLQVYLFSGRRDILFNMLQAVSYLADAWFVYAISKKVGINDKFAALSVFLFMTMPIAFGEALNTQVDLFAALWLLIFVYYYIDLFEKNLIIADKETLLKVVLMALCVSLGYLAKPSVNVGMAILLVILFVKCLRCNSRWGELLKLFLTAVPFVFLPLLPEWIRNYQTFSALSVPSVGARQLIGTLRPNYVLVNLIKNFAHNLPNIYFYNSEKFITDIVSAVAIILQVELNDPSISEDGLEYVMKKVPVYGHDTATNPLILALSVMCFIWCLSHVRENKSKGNRYSIYSMALLLAFCGTVRWEPYVNRYMLPYLALLCPMVGYQLQEMKFREKYIGKYLGIIASFLCFMTLFSLVSYHSGKLPEKEKGRSSGYFINDEGMYPEYEYVFSTLEADGCQTIGIKVSAVNFEYPMWKFSKYSVDRIENILVENASAKYEDMEYIPDCLIMDKENALGKIVVHGQEYYIPEKFQDNQRIAVLYKSEGN